MKKLLLILVLLCSVSIPMNAGGPVASTITNPEPTPWCNNIFYEGRHYVRRYNVDDMWVCGRLCYANWHNNTRFITRTALRLNRHTCEFNYKVVNKVYWFTWEPYR